MKKFYFELRLAHQRDGTTPITLRQLESLMRLTEVWINKPFFCSRIGQEKKNFNFIFKARAKLELREQCTESDALEVVQIMRASMIDTYTDENGQLDFTRSHHGSGMSRSSEVCIVS